VGAAQAGEGFPAGDAALVSTTLGWRLVNPSMPGEWMVSLGESTELLREREGIGRDEQDAFALRSHVSATKAWDDRFYDNQLVFIDGTDLK
jgi:acetyl-CoA acetyltransferase